MLTIARAAGAMPRGWIILGLALAAWAPVIALGWALSLAF